MSATNVKVFVFGSNEAGRHGKGAAKFARAKHGAIYGQGFGLQGTSFAIPTKDATPATIGTMKVLALDVIAGYVARFVSFAIAHPELSFQVTRIGCGLSGYADEQIAPLFGGAPDNCTFDTAWKPWLGARTYWGHRD
jgi:hypothetical protein